MHSEGNVESFETPHYVVCIVTTGLKTAKGRRCLLARSLPWKWSMWYFPALSQNNIMLGHAVAYAGHVDVW